MNKAVICIGSNEDKEANIASSRLLLSKIFSNIVYSETCITKPYGRNYENDFINQLGIIHTEQTKDEVSLILKSIEIEMGRTSLDKEEGIVIIDIDLIIWNDEILKPEEMARTYIKNILTTLPLAI